MRLGADRIDVVENERIHGVFIVHPSQVAVLAAGGIAHLRHQLEDVGFRGVLAWPSFPGWARGGNIVTPSDPEWLLWVAATPNHTASYRRELTDDLRVADAWVAGNELEPRSDREEQHLTPPHPYAVEWGPPMRDAIGVFRAFGVGYPIPERMA